MLSPTPIFMSPSHRRRWPAVMLMLAWLWLSAQPAHAATFTVTSTADGGPGSLRALIPQANNSPGVDTILNGNCPHFFPLK